MKVFYVACFLVVISSCATRLHYVGNSLPASRRVDVFIDPSSIEKPYTIMGKGYISHSQLASEKYINKIQPLAVAKGKQKGADAVLIEDYYVPAVATDLHTTLRTGSAARSRISAGTTSVQQTGEQKFTVLFLKYKE